MASSPTAPRYTVTARVLHWLIAIAIVGALCVALTFDDMPISPRKIRLINYHKWFGLTVLFLLVARAAWRFGHRPPTLPASMPAWQVRAAHASHGLLYLLMLVVPILGWFLSSADGFPITYLGLIPLPSLTAKDKAVAEVLEDAHAVLAWTLIVVASAHALAALKHHVVDRDDVLRRML